MTGNAEDFKQFLERIFLDSLATLKKTGSLNPSFFLVLKNKIEAYIPENPMIMNSVSGKQALAGLLQERVNKGDVLAVISTMDAYISESTEKGNSLSVEVYTAFLADLGAKKMAELGLCSRREVILVTLQSEDFHLTRGAYYKRSKEKIEVQESFSKEHKGSEIQGHLFFFNKGNQTDSQQKKDTTIN